MGEEIILWQGLPGYKTLLKSFLFELKKRDLFNLTDIVKDTSIHFLLNEKLLNVFITILFSKTKYFTTYMYNYNILDCMIVLLSLKHLNYLILGLNH